MEETLTRKIKIYCPQHQTTFEIAEGKKIVCEIKEHALSNNFPNEEFWEYCCDCQTFSPTNLEVGGKAKNTCQHCERSTKSRFLCGNCKIVSFDSSEDTRGKIVWIDFNAKTVEPACAGCLKEFTKTELQLHKCEAAQVVFLTSRKDCPFCKKAVQPKKNLPKKQHISVIDEIFPAKSKLLDVICPACGVPREPDSAFCPNCGQAFKAVKPQPKPRPIPPPIPVVKFDKVANVKTPITVKPTSSGQGLTIVGIILSLVIGCCICGKLQSGKKDYDSSFPATDYKPSNSNYGNTSLSSNYGNNYSNSGNVNNSTANTVTKSNKIQTKPRVSNKNLNVDMNESNQTVGELINESNVIIQANQPSKNSQPQSTPSKVNTMPNVNPAVTPAANRLRKVNSQ